MALVEKKQTEAKGKVNANSGDWTGDRPPEQTPSEQTSGPYKFGWFDGFCLWYPPGWLILFNRHWQHYHDDPDGWIWPEYLLFLIPGGFYLAMLIRWLRLGCRSPRQQVSQVDPTYQQQFRQEILLPILQRYFRAELHHPEHVPDSGPLLIVMNHAGMCFPWDFLGLGVLLSQRQGWFVQPLAHTIFFDHPWLNWWLPPGWLDTMGGLRAERESFESAFETSSQRILLYAPESWRGLEKGWQQRHQLATFDPSFVRVSDRHQVPILPVICLGNEYLHPWAFNLKKMAQWVNLPIFPVSPLLFVFLLFPSMGVWTARTRLRYFIQPLEQPWTEQKESLQRRSLAYQKAQQLRSRLQEAINRLTNRRKS